MNPTDKEKTAFTDGRRLFQWKRMPFGLRTAPSTFQRMVNLVLASVLGKHSLAYLDDIIIFSKTFEDHLVHLSETLSLLRKAGFKLNIEKCNFCVKELKFLGFLVSSEGISPDPEKVKSILDMNVPMCVKDIRRFLGAAGYFRKHIKDYAKFAESLSRLTRKNSTFLWSPDQDKAF